MANSRKPGTFGHDRLSWKIVPDRTPGPLGVNDAADPNCMAWQGDTPGSLGVNDHASQEKPKQHTALNNVQDESQIALDHALQLVEDLISAGNTFGATTAAELLKFWRDGGDDRLGASRSEDKWTNMYGTKLSGKRLPKSLFWPSHKVGVCKLLELPRKHFIEGTRARLADTVSSELRTAAP